MAVKRDQADIWFSKAVRLRDGKCMHCHKTDRLENAHISTAGPTSGYAGPCQIV